MKEYYENRSKSYLTRRTPVIIRIDGCHFHSFCRGLRKPYDPTFIKAMQLTTKDLCENIQGCKIGYVESDEISLLLTDYDTLQTDAWFDYSVQSKFDGGYQVVDHTGTIRYFGWNYGGGRTQELYIQKKTTFTTRKPMTESKKPVKKNLKEDVGGCFYVIHERPIGYNGYLGWIDEYSELTSDFDSAEHYGTLQEAVDMLYAIEDYVESFNDGEGIRVTIQCVNPEDENRDLEDVAIVAIQKRQGVVDCRIVLGKQNLNYCGYRV